jgi:aspartokinase
VEALAGGGHAKLCEPTGWQACPRRLLQWTPMDSRAYTSFERRRGVTDVRLREGVAHLQVTGLARETLMAERLTGLDSVRRAEVKLDFLKLTTDGFTFVVASEDADRAAAALRADGFAVEVANGRSVISVHCVNIRDEAGIVAQIAEATTASGAHIEQVGDSHDCILLVAEHDAAHRAADALRAAFRLEAGDAN